MTNFENLLEQYQPMISAIIRRLHIYKDFELFRHVGAIALWQAWQRYDEKKGDFTPFAYRSIYGAMLDELKKENRQTAQLIYQSSEALNEISLQPDQTEWSTPLAEALQTLTKEERKLLHWLFVEKLTYAQCAKKAGISKDGITKRRQRLLTKLRQHPVLAPFARSPASTFESDS